MSARRDVAKLWPLSRDSNHFRRQAIRSYLLEPTTTGSNGSGDSRDEAAHVVVMDAPTTPIFLTPQQVSESLQISIRTLEDWRLRGYGPPFLPVGKHVRYPLAGFEAWVAAGTKGAA